GMCRLAGLPTNTLEAPLKLNACPTSPDPYAGVPTHVPLLLLIISFGLPSPGHQLTRSGGGGVQPPCSMVKPCASVSMVPSRCVMTTSRGPGVAPVRSKVTVMVLACTAEGFAPTISGCPAVASFTVAPV